MTVQRVLAMIAAISGCAGAISAVPTHPVLQASLLLLFIVAGPGSAILCWLDLPVSATLAGVVGISFAVVTMIATSLAWLGFWHPVPSCVAVSLIVAVTGLLRAYQLAGANRGLR